MFPAFKACLTFFIYKQDKRGRHYPRVQRRKPLRRRRTSNTPSKNRSDTTARRLKCRSWYLPSSRARSIERRDRRTTGLSSDVPSDPSRMPRVTPWIVVLRGSGQLSVYFSLTELSGIRHFVPLIEKRCMLRAGGSAMSNKPSMDGMHYSTCSLMQARGARSEKVDSSRLRHIWVSSFSTVLYGIC